jgi:ERCC4-type nuclease
LNESNEIFLLDKNNQSDKEYISLVKKVKKDNITQHNIDEILLCQIPGISNVTAIALVKHFGSLLKIIEAFNKNIDCWKEVSYVNEKNQTRKLAKTIGTNICKYLLKK